MISETAQSQVQLDNPSMCFPFIHMNGNDGKSLGRQYFDALRALEQFSEKFFAVEFHSRDYYPKGNESWNMAVSQRDEVKQKIKDIRKHLELHAAHCFEAARK
jgi:hypothetical protein